MSATTILIVEDEAIVAADLAGKLARLGYGVVGTTARGDDAVALVGHLHPQLVLMDIWLEGAVDGIEAAEAIRREHDVPVVYLTAHSDPATLARAKLTGPFGYVLKPFDERDLTTQIEMALYHHQAERQLREQREWLRVTLTSIGDAVIATDAAGQITFLNPVAASLTGWKADEAMGQPIQSVCRIVNEQTGQPVEEPVARVLRERCVIELANHTALITKDCRTVPIEDSAAPILDVAGNVIGVVLVFHDVTEKRRADEELRQSRENLDRAQEIGRVGWWRLDTQRNLLTWSDETYRIFGLPKGAPLNYDVFLSSIHPEDRSSVDARWQAALRGEPYDIEHRTVADGTVKWVREKAFLEFDEAGQLSGGFGIAQDISERKQAEEALRQAEERRVAAEAREAERARFNHVLDMLPAYVILLSPDYRIPFANRFFEERFGRSEGRCCYEYLFHRSEPCENCETYKVLKTGMPHRWEWTGPDSRNYDIYDFPFTDVNGSPLIMEVGLDITEQKKAAAALKESNENLERRVVERTEELRKAKEAAEAANTAKSQFLANMSHELRTPMNAILGMIDVALPKADDPVVDDCLRTAKGSADLLLALLNDLLDSAKIESGRLELESAPFSLRHVLDQLSRVLSIRASEKGLTFSCRVPPDSPDVVVGDRMRLQQILLNLGGNAIKFTERGEVEVSLDAVVNDGETTLQFTVRDTGIGIPPAGLVRLFQPFAQADASTTRRFGGTGLGLSICKNLVEAMGGRIWVESEVGKGSKFAFSVRLPLAAELPADFTAPTTVSPTAVAALRILLVEDNPANQKLAKYILEDRGHVVEIAANGREAIDLTETNCYHAILMDVQMPGMNGLEATAAIREREKDGRRTPIVAMTAHAMRGDRERFLGAGMDGYLAKPIDARDLIGLVESLASQGDPKPGCSTSRPCTAGRVPPDEPAIFNAHRALESCFDNEEMLRQMIDCFFADEATLLPAMRQAQEKHDLDAVGRLAHRVRGTLAYLAAPKAFEDAHRIECLCSRGSDATEIRREIDLLEHECAALRVALREYLQSTNER